MRGANVLVLGCNAGFALLCSQVCRDAVDLLAELGEQLCAALATFVADVAGYLAFFLQLIECCLQFDIDLEEAAVLAVNVLVFMFKTS